jgi:hypothetical protein
LNPLCSTCDCTFNNAEHHTHINTYARSFSQNPPHRQCARRPSRSGPAQPHTDSTTHTNTIYARSFSQKWPHRHCARGPSRSHPDQSSAHRKCSEREKDMQLRSELSQPRRSNFSFAPNHLLFVAEAATAGEPSRACSSCAAALLRQVSTAEEPSRAKARA